MANEVAEYDKAIQYYEQALASYLKTFGEDHPDVVYLKKDIEIMRKLSTSEPN